MSHRCSATETPEDLITSVSTPRTQLVGIVLNQYLYLDFSNVPK